MRAYVITFVVALVLGLAGGVALGVFAYPYVFLADIVATEKVDKPAGVERKRARTLRVLQVNGDLVSLVELAHAPRLFLREQQTAVRSTDDPVGVVGSLPDKRPSRAGRNNTRNLHDCDVSYGLLLTSRLQSGLARSES